MLLPSRMRLVFASRILVLNVACKGSKGILFFRRYTEIVTYQTEKIAQCSLHTKEATTKYGHRKGGRSHTTTFCCNLSPQDYKQEADIGTSLFSVVLRCSIAFTNNAIIHAFSIQVKTCCSKYCLANCCTILGICKHMLTRSNRSKGFFPENVLFDLYGAQDVLRRIICIVPLL